MFTSLARMVLLAALGCQPYAQRNAETTKDSNMPGTARDTSSGARSADTSGVTLSLDKTEYSPGGAVVMTISSQRADTLGYNPCSDRSVERETGGGWVVHPEPNRMCTMELRLLKPAETQTAGTDVPADVTAGT